VIVADTNLIVAFTLPHPMSATAEQVRRKDGIWYAPSIWLSEWRNVALRYVRKRLVGLSDVEEALSLAKEAVPRERTLQVDDLLALRVAARTGCSSYDGEFVALAELLDVQFVTWDHDVLRRVPIRAISPDAFASVPD